MGEGYTLGDPSRVGFKGAGWWGRDTCWEIPPEWVSRGLGGGGIHAGRSLQSGFQGGWVVVEGYALGDPTRVGFKGAGWSGFHTGFSVWGGGGGEESIYEKEGFVMRKRGVGDK